MLKAVFDDVSDSIGKVTERPWIARYVSHLTVRLDAKATHKPLGEFSGESDPKRGPPCRLVGTVAMPTSWRQYDQRAFRSGMASAKKLHSATALLDKDELPLVQDASFLPCEEVFVGVGG